MDLLQSDSAGAKHAICSMISVIACTTVGVEYLTLHGL